MFHCELSSPAGTWQHFATHPRAQTLEDPIFCMGQSHMELLSCSPHEPQASPHPCLDVTGAPYSPHSVQILVAAGEHHAHGLVAFPDLGHDFFIHELSLALVFQSLKVQTPVEEQ